MNSFGEYLQIQWWSRRRGSCRWHLERRRRYLCPKREWFAVGKMCGWRANLLERKGLWTFPWHLFLVPGKHSWPKRTTPAGAKSRSSSVLTPWFCLSQSDCVTLVCAFTGYLYRDGNSVGLWLKSMSMFPWRTSSSHHYFDIYFMFEEFPIRLSRRVNSAAP